MCKFFEKHVFFLNIFLLGCHRWGTVIVVTHSYVGHTKKRGVSCLYVSCFGVVRGSGEPDLEKILFLSLMPTLVKILLFWMFSFQPGGTQAFPCTYL